MSELTKQLKNTKQSSKLEIYYDKMLGSGSFAKVYMAKYRDNLVAIKIVSTQNIKDSLYKQFKRELDIINILKSNAHPNVPIYHKIIDDKPNSRLMYVMEWCRNGELADIVKLGLSISQIKEYFRQIVSGYSHLLSLNIVHRDLKTQNILLNEDYKIVKIIDFGLSKIVDTDLTKTVVGSPAYMAPERFSESYTSASDVWSLGIILYEMTYGSNPFKSCKNKAMLLKSMDKPIELKLYRSDKKIPDYLISHMRNMLNIDVDKRFDWDDVKLLDLKLTQAELDEFDESTRYCMSSNRMSSDRISCNRSIDLNFSHNSSGSGSMAGSGSMHNSKSKDDYQIIDTTPIVLSITLNHKELECLDEYFIMDDPNVFSLYEFTNRSNSINSMNSTNSMNLPKAQKQEMSSGSFLDNMPFLMDDFEPKSIKTRSIEFGDMILNKVKNKFK